MVGDKIASIESKLVELDRRGDANVVLDEARDLVRAVEVKIYDLQRALVIIDSSYLMKLYSLENED